jgi:hypothetical protein
MLKLQTMANQEAFQLFTETPYAVVGVEGMHGFCRPYGT